MASEWLIPAIERMGIGTKHEPYVILTLQKLHLKKLGFAKPAITKIMEENKIVEENKIDIKKELENLTIAELDRICNKLINKVRELKKPTNEAYDDFKEKCKTIIQNAISGHEEDCVINFKKIFAPLYNCYNNGKIEIIYNELEDFFWNDFGISIHFGGNNNGSCVDIYYTHDKDDIKRHLYSDKLEDEMKSKVTDFLPLVIEQLKTMELNESQWLEMDGVCMIGYMFPYFYRLLSDMLEEMNLGKIISSNGRKNVLKICLKKN